MRIPPILACLAVLISSVAALACPFCGGGHGMMHRPMPRPMPRPMLPPPGYGFPFYPATGSYPNSAYGQAPASGYSMIQPSAVSGWNDRKQSKPTITAPTPVAKTEPTPPSVGTVRMRYWTFTVAALTVVEAERVERELGKLTGVRGVTVKRGTAPATIKVWYSEQEPLAEKEALARLEQLGFQAALARAD